MTNPDIPAWKWVESDRLPQVVADHDVCLGIFGITPKALRVVPNKVYQGAAAGCGVVTSDTPPQTRTLGDSALLVETEDAFALAEASRALGADRIVTQRLKEASWRRSCERFTPEAIVHPLDLALTVQSALVGR